MVRLPAWMCMSLGVPGTAAYDPGMSAVVPPSVPATVLEQGLSLTCPTSWHLPLANLVRSLEPDPALARCIARQGFGEVTPWKRRQLHFLF